MGACARPPIPRYASAMRGSRMPMRTSASESRRTPLEAWGAVWAVRAEWASGAERVSPLSTPNQPPMKPSNSTGGGEDGGKLGGLGARGGGEGGGGGGRGAGKLGGGGEGVGEGGGGGGGHGGGGCGGGGQGGGAYGGGGGGGLMWHVRCISSVSGTFCGAGSGKNWKLQPNRPTAPLMVWAAESLTLTVSPASVCESS